MSEIISLGLAFASDGKFSRLSPHDYLFSGVARAVQSIIADAGPEAFRCRPVAVVLF